MQSLRTRLLAAGVLAAIAFLLYFTTLLPGQDLGDTASFQAIVGRSPAGPAPGVSALLRDERRARPAASRRGGTRRQPRVGDRRRGARRRPRGPGRRRTGGHAGGRPRRGPAARGFLHVLVAGRSSPRSTRFTCCSRAPVCWPCSPGRRGPRPPASRCSSHSARSASATTCRWCCCCRASRCCWSRPPPMARSRCCGRACLALAAAMAALFALQYAWNIRWLLAEYPNAAFGELAAHVLVRRDQGGLAREHGLRDPDLDARGSVRDVLVRPPPAVRDSRRVRPPSLDSPRCSGSSGASARCC